MFWITFKSHKIIQSRKLNLIYIYIYYVLYISYSVKFDTEDTKVAIYCIMIWIDLNDATTSHWVRGKMDATYHTILSNAFSCAKISVFVITFNHNLFPMVKLTIHPHWIRQCRGVGQAPKHFGTFGVIGYQRMYASRSFIQMQDRMHSRMLQVTWT